MADQNRMLLDELMGPDRDRPITERKSIREHYSDDNVCKNFLVSICFNELFPNTKHDEGQCTKRHDSYLKRQFEDDADENKFHLEKRYINTSINYIEGKLSEVDSIIRKNKEYLETKVPSELPAELTERIEQFEVDIKNLLEQSALLGEEGKIEDSEKMAVEADKLIQKKEEMIRFAENPLGGNKEMKICEVCGAQQTVHDTEKRIQTHLEGKIHKGFLTLRAELEKLKLRRQEVRNFAESYYEKKKKEKKRDHSSDRKHKKRSHKSRSRSRDHKSRHHKKSKRYSSSSSASRSRSRHNRKYRRSSSNERRKSKKYR